MEFIAISKKWNLLIDPSLIKYSPSLDLTVFKKLKL